MIFHSKPLVYLRPVTLVSFSVGRDTYLRPGDLSPPARLRGNWARECSLKSGNWS